MQHGTVHITRRMTWMTGYDWDGGCRICGQAQEVGVLLRGKGMVVVLVESITGNVAVGREPPQAVQATRRGLCSGSGVWR